MDCYLGMVMTFAYNWAPVGFAACNGQTTQIMQNQALYSLLGVAFGGNGSTSFNLPDLRGRTPVHFGQGTNLTPRTFAAQFGQENGTLTVANLPPHNHAIGEKTAGQTVTATAAATVNAGDVQGSLNKPQNTAYWAKGWDAADASVLSNYTTTKNVTMASDAVQVTVTPAFNASNLNVANTGGGGAFPLAQPSLALNFCICTSGLYPSRS